MDYTVLGRTGLSVSVMGLGCGGHSRLGLSTGGTEEQAANLVRRAFDLGINFIDTAEGYGTESAVGKGITGLPRDSVVLSTKLSVRHNDQLTTAAEFRERAAACLKRLGTDYIDVLHLHGVAPDDYAYAASEIVPALRDLQSAGQVRYLGITEAFASDPTHRMLSQAVQDDCWDVMMIGFNILNQSARERVLATTREKRIGTLCMFAVRRALSRPDALAEVVQRLMAEGKIAADACDPNDPLGFLMEEGVAESVVEAAYRFCRYEPGIDVTLVGTGNPAHLEANAASLSLPPLPADVVERLQWTFQGVDSVSGN